MNYTGAAKSAIGKVADELVKLGDEVVDISIKKHREKRSLDANAYFWVLADRLAKAVSTKGTRPVTSLDVYREYIKDVGAFEYIPIKSEVVARWCEIWTAKGQGWLCEDMGECKRTPGYHNVKCYYGSSVYNREQMTRLIDLLVADCKENGIETRTPTELAEMMSLWEVKDK